MGSLLTDLSEVYWLCCRTNLWATDHSTINLHKR